MRLSVGWAGYHPRYRMWLCVCVFVCLSQYLSGRIGNTNGYIAGILNFPYHFLQVKNLSQTKNCGHFEFFEISNTATIRPQIWKHCPNLCPQKVFFIVITLSMMSQGGLKVGPLHFFTNEIRKIFPITNRRTKIPSLNFLHIGIMGLWLYSHNSIFMT